MAHTPALVVWDHMSQLDRYEAQRESASARMMPRSQRVLAFAVWRSGARGLRTATSHARTSEAGCGGAACGGRARVRWDRHAHNRSVPGSSPGGPATTNLCIFDWLRGYHGRSPNGKMEPCNKDLLHFLSLVGAQRPRCRSSHSPEIRSTPTSDCCSRMGHREPRSLEK